MDTDGFICVHLDLSCISPALVALEELNFFNEPPSLREASANAQRLAEKDAKEEREK